MEVRSLMGTEPGATDHTSLRDVPYLNAEWEQPRELVLLEGDGHWWIALDYRACGPDGEPPVVLYDNDVEPHDVVELAPSFRAFVCLLEPLPEIEVEVDPDAQVWIEEDFAREHGIELPPGQRDT